MDFVRGKVVCGLVILVLSIVLFDPFSFYTYAATPDPETVLLLHGDGSDASTNIIDSSNAARTISTSNQAQIDTAQSKFGGASVLFDGVNDAISTADSADFTFAGDFTIDMWVRFNSSTSSSQVFVQHEYLGGAQGGFIFQYGSTNGLQFIANSPSCTAQQGAITGWLQNTWYHVAAVRSGTTVTVYRDGTALGSGSCTGTFNGNASLFLGTYSNGTADFGGWVDEVRILNGVAYWTANFTPPTQAYARGISLTKDVFVTASTSVNGTISKGSGTFMIDHPLDPKNKLLYHSFVESPDVKNLYDGIAELDANGEAKIQLPTYFLALNEDFRYLATPIGESMPDLHIGGRVTRLPFGLFGGTYFVVSGGKPHGKVSWQVTGNRKDLFIRENPITVDVEKGPDQVIDKGKCLFEPLCE